MKSFPRTEVAGMSLPRMIIGSNWILGYSHRSPAADKMIQSKYGDKESIARLLEAYLQYDINAIMAPIEEGSVLLEGIRLAEKSTGKKMIIINTPVVDVSDTDEGRASAAKTIEDCRRIGSDFCLIHHASCEQLVSKLHETMDRLPDYLAMIRSEGMIPGLSAHMPEIIQYSDRNGYDVETYIQIYNCLGFLMQVEVENVAKVIWNAKKPVMTIKSMAAGRCTPYVGLSFSYHTIRDCDMVTVGAHTVDEVHEDIEIALAALENRFPNMASRNSPKRTQLLGW
ncbi:MAG: hypothetical protein H7X94_11895 [Vallitaleaceae bacterium]|nr:hypothetical protein [Vallitaleaceae bacterium]